ncbi:putative DNA polymerase [Pseudomonas phage MR14]|nr:putative DNA polymerase [Pseudomonas phage MR14]
MTIAAPPPPRASAPLPPLHLLRAGQRLPVAWGYSTVLPDMDFEGFSAAGFEWDDASQKYKAPIGATKKGLPAIGAAKYADDPSTEVLCLAYDLKDGTGRKMWLPGQPLPLDLIQHLAQFDASAPPSYEQRGLCETHNSMFEFRVWTRVLHERWGWPAIDLRQMRCSMAKARAYSLPGALGNLAEVLRVPVGKDKDGKKQLERFSWPRNPTKSDRRTRITCAEDPENAAKLYSYCDQDIVAEAGASARMPDLIPQELEYWLADQACNWRGVGVDLESVNACISVLDQAHRKYNAELYEITGGTVARASEISKLQEWVADCTGYRMKSGDSEAIEEAMAAVTEPHVLRALEIRNLIGSAAVKKVYAMARMATRDARLCDLFIYHGARTGRDTHADVQPGNLPKSGPNIRWCENAGCGKPYAHAANGCPWCGASSAFSTERSPEGEKGWTWEAVEDALAIMRHGNLELVEYFFGDAVLTISGCVRSLLVAAPQHELLCSDYSAIEAVVLAVLAGEQWRIDAFHRGESIYYHGAAGVTGKSYEWYEAYRKEHGTHHPDRNKIGKVCLGPETQVLTDRGYLAIVDVLSTDKLWDGVEWVKHSGLLDQGQKETMRLDGVRITPDHLVNSNGSWKAASELGSCPNTLRTALETGSESLPWSAKNPPNAFGFGAPAGRLNTALPQQTCARVFRLVAINAQKLLRQLTEKCSIAMPTQWPTTSTAGDCSTGSPPPLADATTQNKSNTIATGGGVLKCANSGEMTRRLSWFMCRVSRAGITQASTWIGRIVTLVTCRATSDSSRVEPTHSIKEKSILSKTKSSSYVCESSNSRRVYDLANAGPRHRFTIKTNSGHLIVHNCELALGFMGWTGAWRNFDKSDNFTDDEVKALIVKWRDASPMLAECAGGQVRGKPWRPDRFENYGYEGMFLNAVLNPGQIFEYRGIQFQVLDDTMFVTLLSGRRLTYHAPRAERTERFSGVQTYALTYMTWNSNPSFGPIGWHRMETYAGRILENLCQATARDLMSAAVVRLESAGYPVVMRVHDEIVSEVPEGYGSNEEFEALMAQLPDWAAGWPVRCGGTYRSRRYKK